MHHSYGVSSLIGTAVTLPILSITAVLLRFYVRLRIRRTNIGSDDWLCLLSLVFIVGQAIIQVLGMQCSVRRLRRLILLLCPFLMVNSLDAFYGIDGRDGEHVSEARVAYTNRVSRRLPL